MHVPSAFLTLFDEILAEGYCSFSVGEEVQKVAVISVEHEDFYDPGIIEMNVTVENVGTERTLLRCLLLLLAMQLFRAKLYSWWRDRATLNLKIEVSRIDNTTFVYVKTDAGGAVEDATVILNGIKKVTDEGEVARFEYLNATEFLVKAEKFGFNPIVEKVYISEEESFDTGAPSNPYPSIFGNHTGTIKPNHTVIAIKLYTYPCSGGHTEYAFGMKHGTQPLIGKYVGDWHNITFDKPVVLMANEEYNYTIRTGSYPQIHHTSALLTNGWMNCTEFTDANGKVYYDWIPAIKLQ